jgi:hypothetical protein
MTDDLWGDIPDVTSVRTPHAILAEQAEVLTRKTKGLLVGRVSRAPSGPQFQSVLSIVAPALNNYSYVVLAITHPISMYPLNLSNAGTGQTFSLQNEAELLGKLGEFLSSTQVRNVIAGLLAQINADPASKNA